MIAAIGLVIPTLSSYVSLQAFLCCVPFQLSMGLLAQGHTLIWTAVPRNIVEYVKQHGVMQFINIYEAVKDREHDCLTWGDEVEYMIVHFEEQQHTALLALEANDLLDTLSHSEQSKPATHFLPEYAAYMVEGDCTTFHHILTLQPPLVNHITEIIHHLVL